MSQDGERAERKDINTRALVDAVARIIEAKFQAELASVKAELKELRAQQDNAITFKGAMGASVAILLIAGGLGVFFLSRAEAASRDAGAEAMTVAKEAKADVRDLSNFVKQDLREMRAEQKADMQELKAEIRNSNRGETRRPRHRPPPDGGPTPLDGGGTRVGP